MKDPLFIQNVAIEWEALEEDSYVRDIPALRSMGTLVFTHNITLLVGENGTGKSTLLEAMAIHYGFNPEGGTLNYRFHTYDDYSDLHEGIRMQRHYSKPRANYFFRAESFFNMATKAIDYKVADYHSMSHGESFLSFFQSFDSAGLFIMDEPEAALSPQRQLTLLIDICHLAKLGAQFIIATHSPILLGLPGAKLLSFDDGIIKPINYEDTASYQVTKRFLNDRESFLKLLLADQ